jgi:hypothetical protein
MTVVPWLGIVAERSDELAGAVADQEPDRPS